MADTNDSVTLVNHSNAESVDLELRHGTAGPDAVDITPLFQKAGLFTYDPGFVSTASCHSAITYIDGDAGILRYRGYPIEQLAEKSTFLEVAYLLLWGELPTRAQLDKFTSDVTHHTMLNQSLLKFYNGFHHNAHPMAVMVGVVGSLSAFYHDSLYIQNPAHRELSGLRMIAKMPTIAAAAYKHNIGEPVLYPQNRLSYCANFLHMMFATPCEPYEPPKLAEQALDLLFILHADHEQNASTSTVRMAGSSGANPFACVAAGIAALWGPAHGGANEAVLDMLEEIGDVRNIEKYIAKAKDKDDPFRLMGFGHRIYKNYDPRATIIDVPRRAARAGDRARPAVRAGAAPRGDRGARRLLRRAQAVPERRLLLGDHLPRARHPAEHVHGAVRHRPHRRLGGALDGDDGRPEAAHQPAAAGLRRGGAARLRADHRAALRLGRVKQGRQFRPAQRDAGAARRRVARRVAPVRRAQDHQLDLVAVHSHPEGRPGLAAPATEQQPSLTLLPRDPPVEEPEDHLLGRVRKEPDGNQGVRLGDTDGDFVNKLRLQVAELRHHVEGDPAQPVEMIGTGAEQPLPLRPRRLDLARLGPLPLVDTAVALRGLAPRRVHAGEPALRQQPHGLGGNQLTQSLALAL